MRVSSIHAMRSGGLVCDSYLTVHPDGRMVQLDFPSTFSPEAPEKRGNVDGFSDDSRRRLMQLLHSIRRDARNPAFVTLTFPDEKIPTMREAKKYLQTLFKRWKRKHKTWSAIWRLEKHPIRSERLGKDVPHFHLLVWGGWIDRDQLSEDWAEVVATEQLVFAKHLRGGTKVETIRSFAGVCYYASKYLSKVECAPTKDTGRVWGIHNAPALPVSRAVTIKLTTRQVVAARRETRAFMRKKGIESEWILKTLYLDDPREFLRKIGVRLC